MEYCVRDVSWHGYKPEMISAAWDPNGRGSLAKHEWKGMGKHAVSTVTDARCVRRSGGKGPSGGKEMLTSLIGFLGGVDDDRGCECERVAGEERLLDMSRDPHTYCLSALSFTRTSSTLPPPVSPSPSGCCTYLLLLTPALALDPRLPSPPRRARAFVVLSPPVHLRFIIFLSQPSFLLDLERAKLVFLGYRKEKGTTRTLRGMRGQ